MGKNIRMQALMLLLLILSGKIEAQSHHTVVFTGNPTDFTPNEKRSAAANNTDYYITFDENYLYIGAFRTGGMTFGVTDNLAIYLDTDPNNTPTSGTGTTTGQSYSNVTGTLPFTANYNVHVQQDYKEARSFDSNWGNTIDGLSYWTNNTAREVRIPFESIGYPHALYITMWMGYNGGIFSNVPGANIGASNNPTITDYFGGIGLSSADCIPVLITNSPITHALTNTSPSPGVSYGKILVDAGAVTANVDFGIAPGGSIIVNGGTLDISNSSIAMGGSVIGDGRGTTIKTSSSGILATSSATSIIFNGEGNLVGNPLELEGLVALNRRFTPLPDGTFTVGPSGILDIRSGSYIHANSPSYASESELRYSSGSHYQRRVEWNSNIGGAFGLPHHVRITNATTLDYPFESPGPLGITGNLIIDSGSALYMDYSNASSNGPLTVLGDLISAGNMTLGTSAGNDLKVGGNITFSSGYTFDAKNRAVFFVKDGEQLITAASKPTFHKIIFAPTSGTTTVKLATGTNLDITAPSGVNESIDFGSGYNQFDLNGNILTLGTPGITNKISGTNGGFKGSPSSELIVLGTGDPIGNLKFMENFRELKSLTVDRQSGIKAIDLKSDLMIHSSLILTNGLIDLGTSNLTLGLNATIIGGSANSYIIADESYTAGVSTSGKLKKLYTASTGTFTFPIGDRTTSDNGSNYSPATIQCSDGNYSATAYIALSVNDIKHPSISATADYLSRYWKIKTAGISGTPNFTFTGSYSPADIVGTESNSTAGRWNGNEWTEGLPMGSNILSLTINSGIGTDFINEIGAGNPLGTSKIRVVGNNNSIISGDLSPDASDFTDFGNQPANRYRTFLIQNTADGKIPLEITSITLDGLHAGDFSIVNSPSLDISVGKTSYLVLKFTPGGTGLRTATVTINNNDPDASVFTFAIQGDGINHIECEYGAEETIASQDFEGSLDNWNFNSTNAIISGGTGYGATGDGGSSPLYIGSNSLQVNQNTASIEFESIDTSELRECSLSFRLGSFSSVSGASGADASDSVIVSVSENGGETWSDETIIYGNSSSKWSFTSGSGIAQTVYDGNGTTSDALFKPRSGGFQTTDGYSTIRLDYLPIVSNLKLKITLSNDASDEIWALDDIQLKAKRKISKIWNGSAWNGDGLPPTASQKAILGGNLTLPYMVEAVEYSSLEGCECEVKTGATLIVGNEEGTTPGTLYLQGALKNTGGIIVFHNNSSLVQQDDLAINQGTVSIKRITQPMFRQDFTYWGSPLSLDSNFKLGGDPVSLSPDTHPTKYYKWKHAAPSQAWEAIINGNEAMHPGRGYIVRAPESFDTEGAPDAEADTYTATFVGKPNNGIVTHAVTGHPTTSKWNLLGNPYPSALNIETFLAANSDYLDGTIYLWTHNSPAQENSTTGFYQYSPNDYAAFNFSGATATTAAALAGGPTPNEFLASGQAFFVKGLSSGMVTFDNSMRVSGNNNLFFKPLPPQPIDNWELTGKHRIWLNITGPDAFNQTLVGYIQNATNGLDWGYDGPHFGGNKVSFYSITADKNLAIQGRALPFNTQDQVPLGYKTSLTGELTIAIDHFDGLFEGQDIYLEDLLLNIVHDLKEAPYTFTTASGTYNNRFLLRYLPEEMLGKAKPATIAAGLMVYKKDNQIIVKSVSEVLEEIQIYDLLGRIIFEKEKLDQYEFGIHNIVMGGQVLIVKVRLANGLVVHKKILH